MNHYDEFDFSIRSIEDNIKLLENKIKYINPNIDIPSKLHKLSNIITIFCIELHTELKETKNKIEHLIDDLTCLNYNNILNDKNILINELNLINKKNINIDNSINIIKSYLNEYLNELNNNKLKINNNINLSER